MSERGWGCFKTGCFGCLGFTALGIVVLLVTGGIQFVSSRGPAQVRDQQRERELPPPRATATAEREGSGTTTAIPLESLESPELASGAAGRIVLDLHLGEFLITAGEPGAPVKIDAEYDPDDFELVEELDEEADGSFTYTISFGGKKSALGMFLSGATNNPENRVEIRLPRGRALAISGELGIGSHELDLGGLWVESVDLKLGTGEHIFHFSEPAPVPMASFRLDKSIGELQVNDLGNASPAEVEVRQQIGSLVVDLEGSWQRDAVVEIECGIGECALELPRNVHISMDRARVGVGEKDVRLPDPDEIPEGAPTLDLRISGSIGEVRAR